jgi:hypothetical protein
MPEGQARFRRPIGIDRAGEQDDVMADGRQRQASGSK